MLGDIYDGVNFHIGTLKFYPIFIPLFGFQVSGVPPEADSGYAISSTFPDT